MNLKLISKQNETGNVKTFTFDPSEPLKWKAGQYLIYRLPHENQDLRGKMRFFTISSSPFEKHPKITTRIDEKKGSSFKKTLNSLKIGDTIDAKGPDGDFTIVDVNNSHIFIAGGIGITPFVSIIRQLNKENKPINITLLYSNKDTDIVFKKELDEIKIKHPEFKIQYFISPERINEESLKKETDMKKSIFYISGPDPMVDAMEEMLLKLGVSKEKIKEDYFSGYEKI